MYTFWKYLKENHIAMLLGFWGIIISFMLYWVMSTSWEESVDDIILTTSIVGGISLFWIIGSYIVYKKLPKE